MPELSGNILQFDVSDQVEAINKKKQQWLSDKADILLKSSNKKELVISLISDFNDALGVCKQIERDAKQALKNDDYKSAIQQILSYFPQSESDTSE